MRGRLAILVRAIVIVVMAVEVPWLVAANVFLATPLAARAINRQPHRFTLAWGWAFSLWPGMVVLRDVETGGRSRRTEWHADIASVVARFDLLPLRRRDVHLRSVRASGVDYRQRRRPEAGVPSAIPFSELPPIPALPAPPPPATAAAAKPRGRPWTVRADRIDCAVEQLWIGRFRLAGPMRVETAMDLQVRGPLSFEGVRVTMEKGDLWAGEQAIFADFGLDIQATVHPFVPRQMRRLETFRYLSGRFALRSETASLFFLEAYFRKAPWLHFRSRANARAVLLLDHGRLLPGTTLEVHSDAIDMEIAGRRLTGAGTTTGRVEVVEGRALSRIESVMHEFALSPAEGGEPYARGRDATLVATSTTLDLADPFTDLKVVFDQPDTSILDASFYNSLIPEGSGFRIVSGTGTLRYHLEGSQEEGSLRGTIGLEMREGVARFQNYDLEGGFSIETPLREARPAERLFDISGTRVRLHADNFGWDALVTLPKAEMRFNDPMTIAATVGLQMEDTRPLVAMFDALKGVPDWLESWMVIENVRGEMGLDVRRGRVAVKDLVVTGKGLKARADMVMGKTGREGILYLRFHGLSMGVEMKKSGRDLKLLLPLRWYERERARRHGHAATPR
jgi:hypothetical protein